MVSPAPRTSRPDQTGLTDWQIALLKSIWRQPALWVNGHPDIEVLRRRGLISAFTQYLALTKAGFDALERVSVDDPV